MRNILFFALAIFTFTKAIAGEIKINAFAGSKSRAEIVSKWIVDKCPNSKEEICLYISSSKTKIYLLVRDLKDKGIDPSLLGINLTALPNIQLSCTLLDEENSNNLCIDGFVIQGTI